MTSVSTKSAMIYGTAVLVFGLFDEGQSESVESCFVSCCLPNFENKSFNFLWKDHSGAPIDPQNSS